MGGSSPGKGSEPGGGKAGDGSGTGGAMGVDFSAIVQNPFVS